MTKPTSGIAAWPFVAQISLIMGFIMTGIDQLLYRIDCSNIVFYTLFFVLISKIATFPMIFKSNKSSFLKLQVYENIKKINEKYKGKDLTQYKFKFQTERHLIEKKYGSKQSGCSAIIIQLLMIIGMYAVLKNLEAFVPRIGALSAEELSNIYTFLGYDLRTVPNMANPLTIIFPFFTVAAECFSIICTELLNKSKTATKKGIQPTSFISPIITFFFCFKLPMFLSICWGMQSIITAIINTSIRFALNRKGEDKFIKEELTKFNENRKKRGLEPLEEMPIVL